MMGHRSENIQGDPFTFMIDHTFKDGTQIGPAAGANNVSVAHKALDELLLHAQGERHFRLRQGSRIIRQESTPR